jgi:hypothetical protein
MPKGMAAQRRGELSQKESERPQNASFRGTSRMCMIVVAPMYGRYVGGDIFPAYRALFTM